MLEEIINYVQSLQRQVEVIWDALPNPLSLLLINSRNLCKYIFYYNLLQFLSMKLASTPPPSLDFNTSNPFQNDVRCLTLWKDYDFWAILLFVLEFIIWFLRNSQIYQQNCSLQTSSMQQLGALAPTLYGVQMQQNGTLNQTHESQLPPNDSFFNGVSEVIHY